MIKRTTTTTTYEYDGDGKIIKKTIVEEVIEEQYQQLQQYPLTNPCKPNTHEFWWNQPYCDNNSTSGANPNLTTTTTTIN